MGQKKKQGKERLDKYYHLAKTQGYRARSAFKLIQLNKKYNFLEKSRVCIDLCAAPGGWLQVASKYMPVSSMIIGVDLAPIKPIPKVITHIEDITTDKCRSALRRDLKDWKADVVLHDGAPNVGAAWIQDAFSQSELTLSALKLAVEFLNRGGTFVTKVFRSKDYNSLLWVFNQLFKRVEATKPPSSRNVSAEIFVVCRDFLAPSKLDPKFLDPKYVFKEVEDIEKPAITQKASMNDLINPEKASKKRHREGYNEGDYTLHHTRSVLEFVALKKEAEAIVILANSHALHWNVLSECDNVVLESLELDRVKPEGQEFADKTWQKEILKKLKTHSSTTEEITTCLQDLKVLGRKDYKSLLKWRQALRKTFFVPEKSKATEETPTSDAATDEQPKTSEELVDELDVLANAAKVAEKREKRKRLERIAKDRRRLQLNMTTPKEIGMEAAAASFIEEDDLVMSNDEDEQEKARLFDLSKLEQQEKNLPLEADMDSEDGLDGVEDSDEALTDLDDSKRSASGSDEESLSEEEELAELENDMDELYKDFLDRKASQNPKERVKLIRSREKEFTGCEPEKSSESESEEEAADSMSCDDSSSSSEDDFVDEEQEAMASMPKENKESALWYSRPVFKGIDLSDQEEEEAEEKDQDLNDTFTLPDIEFGEDMEVKKEQQLNKKKKGNTALQENESDGSADEEEEGHEERLEQIKNVLGDAETLSLAIQMVQDGGRQKRDIMDTYGYNRYTFNDDTDALPQWFVDDENKHNRPIRPITKEAVERIRQRQKELDARPIKKVVEAKARKKFKATKKLEGLRRKMNSMFDEDNAGGDDPEMSAKLGQISKIMRNAMQKSKDQQRKKVKLVVAKGGNRGRAGRPKGVKGRYKMVDSRMKKEVRAQMRKEKKTKK